MGVAKTFGFSKMSEFLIINIPLNTSDTVEELKMCDSSYVGECHLNPDHVNEILYSDEDKSAASVVADLITALPAAENLVLIDAAQVETARLAYDELTESQRALVLNYIVLTTVEGQIGILKEADALAQADASAAQVAIDLISALPAVENLVLDNVAQVEAARSAYDGLTESQKVLVLNYATLTAAEGQIQVLSAQTDIIDDGTTGDDGSGADAPEPEPIPEPVIQTDEDGSITIITI
jgi:hypothetical protein